MHSLLKKKISREFNASFKRRKAINASLDMLQNFVIENIDLNISEHFKSHKRMVFLKQHNRLTNFFFRNSSLILCLFAICRKIFIEKWKP